MASVTTSRLCVMYSTISLRPARFTSLNFKSLSGSETKSKRTQHCRNFCMKSSSRSWGGASEKRAKGKKVHLLHQWNDCYSSIRYIHQMAVLHIFWPLEVLAGKDDWVFSAATPGFGTPCPVTLTCPVSLLDSADVSYKAELFHITKSHNLMLQQHFSVHQL